ncbi:MAG: hypothetical protein CVU65_06330 [Deltaproteobacteria bacterium HGW-Deltaproteobacteria-22]|jgi:SpoIID/LytB domain protein|nr:MAG: hypothetical protein CVU65_06330 [Deltaproteobacteria bacterium HGW-Deltaproteobacteria-22]
MRKILLTLVGLLALSPLASATAAADEPVDLLKTLYQKRFTLDHTGAPLVLIGVASGLDAVEISSPEGVDLLPNGTSGVRISGPKTVKITRTSGTPGRVQYYLALEAVPLSDPDLVAKTRVRLAPRGVTAREQGYVISMGPRMLDTRRVLFSLGPYTAPQASEAMARERAAFPHAFVHAEFATLPSGTFVAASGDNAFRVTQTGAMAFEPTAKSPLAYHLDGKAHRVDGRLIIIFGMDGRLILVNELSIEKYLEGILPSEMFPSAPAEALKAQAVAARGQVLAKMGQRHNTDPFHLCSKVHCQAYDGLEKGDPRTDLAVRQTAGQVLFDAAGFPADTVYSSSCGGHGEHNENVWGGKPNPLLRGRPDGPPLDKDLSRFFRQPSRSFCARLPGGAGASRWKVVRTATELQQSLATVGFSGKVTDLVPRRRGVSGRILELEIRGGAKPLVLSGELVIRRALGGLRSSLFVHKKLKDGAFEFTGAGFGHGVGLCQWGAMGRASGGQKAPEILRHYYPGSLLQKLY